jgi:hypothetical protein
MPCIDARLDASGLSTVHTESDLPSRAPSCRPETHENSPMSSRHLAADLPAPAILGDRCFLLEECAAHSGSFLLFHRATQACFLLISPGRGIGWALNDKVWCPDEHSCWPSRLRPFRSKRLREHNNFRGGREDFRIRASPAGCSRAEGSGRRRNLPPAASGTARPQSPDGREHIREGARFEGENAPDRAESPR